MASMGRLQWTGNELWYAVRTLEQIDVNQL